MPIFMPAKFAGGRIQWSVGSDGNRKVVILGVTLRLANGVALRGITLLAGVNDLAVLGNRSPAPLAACVGVDLNRLRLLDGFPPFHCTYSSFGMGAHPIVKTWVQWKQRLPVRRDGT